MPQWVSIFIGLAAGIAIIAVAIFIAVRPYVSAKPRRPDQSDREDNFHASQWLGNGPFGGDGTGS